MRSRASSSRLPGRSSQLSGAAKRAQSRSKKASKSEKRSVESAARKVERTMRFHQSRSRPGISSGPASGKTIGSACAKMRRKASPTRQAESVTP